MGQLNDITIDCILSITRARRILRRWVGIIQKWTGDVVGRMHVYKITYAQLAGEIGWHAKYLSSVLNGYVSPKRAEEKICFALDRLIEEKNKTEPAR